MPSAFAGVTMVVTGGYRDPASGFETTAAEIAAYDPVSKRIFGTNSETKTLDVLDISNPAAPVKIAALPLGTDPTSVTVHNGVVAVAVTSAVKTDPGTVRLFHAGTFAPLGTHTVGSLPDMVTFNRDGTKLLVANEGEPSGYGGALNVDPEGSISILDISITGYGVVSVNGTTTAGFNAYDAQKAALQTSGVRIFGGNGIAGVTTSVSQDFEPEYITVSPDNTQAFVSLQENNAVATIDLATGAVVAVTPLGTRDFSQPGKGMDASNRDSATNTAAINIGAKPVLGFRSPDGMASFTHNGETYVVTANEGDYRAYAAAAGPAGTVTFAEEVKVSAVGYNLDDAKYGPQEAVLKGNGPDGIGSLTVTGQNGDTDGDGDMDAIMVVGTRDMAIYKVNGNTLEYRADTGDSMEQAVAAQYSANFNASHTSNAADGRSTAKGPEPEGVVVAEIDGKRYAFVIAERIGGIFMYDISDPDSPELEQYINTRIFTDEMGIAGKGGDLGPEGVLFIPAEDSPNGQPMLAISHEISGSYLFVSLATVPEPSTGLLALGGAAVMMRRRRRNA